MKKQNHITEYGFKMWWKIITVPVFGLVVSISIASIIYFYSRGLVSYIIFLSIPVMLSGILGFIQLFVFRILLGSDYIKKIGFTTVQIFYKDVDNIIYDHDFGKFYIKSRRKTIMIWSQLEENEQIISEIVSKLKNLNPQMWIHIEKKIKEKFIKN